jgi:hypothetical protein
MRAILAAVAIAAAALTIGYLRILLRHHTWDE